MKINFQMHIKLTTLNAQCAHTTNFNVQLPLIKMGFEARPPLKTCELSFVYQIIFLVNFLCRPPCMFILTNQSEERASVRIVGGGFVHLIQ